MCQIFKIICKNLYIFYTRTSKIYEHILLRRATWNCAAYCVPRSGVSLGWCFFYSSNIQHMHSHKYWRWTICFTLHRKAFELIKIFVRMSRKKNRTQYEILHRMSSELTYLRSNTKWDYDAFFLLQHYIHMNMLNGCGLRKCIFIIAFEIRGAQVTTEN